MAGKYMTTDIVHVWQFLQCAAHFGAAMNPGIQTLLGRYLREQGFGMRVVGSGAEMDAGARCGSGRGFARAGYHVAR